MPIQAADQKLLSIIQDKFPLAEEPYKQIADMLSLSEEEVINRIKKLKESKIIKRVGPVLDAAALGYRSTLIAVKTTPEKEEETASVISTFPGVTHNYKRPGKFNVWFTLVAESEESLQETIERIQKETDPVCLVRLNARKTYKIRVVLDAG